MKQEYSLWLIPSGNPYKKLNKIASDLIKKYHNYCDPNLELHVTLLGDIFEPKEKVIAKTSKLVKLISPIELIFVNLHFLPEYSNPIDEFFRSLFVKLEETPTLVEANRKAKEIFGRPESRYMPHASIAWGKLPIKIKEQTIKKYGPHYGATCLADARCIADNLYLYAVNRDNTKENKRIMEFSLK